MPSQYSLQHSECVQLRHQDYLLCTYKTHFQLPTAYTSSSYATQTRHQDPTRTTTCKYLSANPFPSKPLWCPWHSQGIPPSRHTRNRYQLTIQFDGPASSEELVFFFFDNPTDDFVSLTALMTTIHLAEKLGEKFLTCSTTRTTAMRKAGIPDDVSEEILSYYLSDLNGDPDTYAAISSYELLYFDDHRTPHEVTLTT